MKKIALILILVNIMSFISVKAETVDYSLTEGDYVRILGRGEEDNGRTFNWLASGFEFEFSGSYAEVFADESFYDERPYEGNYFTMALYDGDELVRTERMKLVAGWNTIYEEKENDPENKIIKFVRSSEACRGTIKMSKLRADAVPKKTAPKEKMIEFIGDSYTAGYGNSPQLSEATAYCAQNTDNWNSYTGMVARHYNADNTVIAYQGRGVCANRSLSDTEGNMSQQFEYSDIYVTAGGKVGPINMSTRAKHDFSLYEPQLVTVWLGTNDQAAPVDNKTFAEAYEKLVWNIKDKYPRSTILCVSLEDSMYYDEISGIVNNLGEKNRCYMLTLDRFKSTSYGHPDIAEDRRIADQFIAKIDSIADVWSYQTAGTDILSVKADYNTDVVTVTGKTNVPGEIVSAMVLKPGETKENLTKDSICFVGDTDTLKNGTFEFKFMVDKLQGNYSYYMNSSESDSYNYKEFCFENYIPNIAVKKDNVDITKINELKTGDVLDVVISGFDVADDFSGMLSVAQYKDGSLYKVDVFDASEDTVKYGTEIECSAAVETDTDLIKVIYINKDTVVPLIGAYVIE